jgi:hypothetical protein
LDRLEVTLWELESSATEDELAAAKTMKVGSPKSWQVIQHVREKFTCRDCEKISQAPAPFHVIARGWAGPSLLGMVLFEKFGQHQPLNRQAERYAKEGVPIVHLPPSMQKTGISAPMMPPICAATKSDGAWPTFHGAASIQMPRSSPVVRISGTSLCPTRPA